MRNNIGQIDVSKSLKVIILLSTCMLYALLLFSMDEGRNSLNGIFETGNLIGLGFYFISMIGFTIAIYQILKIFMRGILAGIISVMTGPVLGISIMFGLFRLISNLF